MDAAALAHALDYLPRWVAHQMRLNDQPGCAMAVVHQGQLVAEFALGQAAPGEALTPRHRFRVASHSKTFTAAAVMLLREQGAWRLDDPVGNFVSGLHPKLARATLAQLLSHTAGVVRDGDDAGQWADRRPFLNEAELRAALAQPPVLEAGQRFKYSNHGYGLLGLAIEAVVGEPYNRWIARHVVRASGLRHTRPDMPLPAQGRLARGHSTRWPLGERVVIPADQSTHALASATGFVATAADVARFFASLDPSAAQSLLSVDSRREMTRRHWPDAGSSLGRWYGLGTISGSTPGAGGDWDWWGHTGGFQGTISRTAVLPAQGLAITALSNAADGASHTWVDGAIQLLRLCAQHGAPSKRTAAWQGRWWSLWGAVDLLPTAERVFALNPVLANPALDAPELVPSAVADDARIARSGGFGSPGETARLERDARGRLQAVWLGGTRLQSEARVAAELRRRYGSAASAG